MSKSIFEEHPDMRVLQLRSGEFQTREDGEEQIIEGYFSVFNSNYDIGYGMSESIPNMSYYDSMGGDYGFTKPYSEETAEMIDQEAKRIISEQYERAKKILSENEEGHHKIAQLLIDKEVIYADDVKEILGERPWESRADELLADEKAAAEQREKDEALLAESKKDNEEAETEVEGQETQFAEESAVNEDIKNEKEK